MRYLDAIKFGMLQVHENEISLRELSAGAAQLCILKGTLARVRVPVFLSSSNSGGAPRQLVSSPLPTLKYQNKYLIKIRTKYACD